MQKRLHDSLIQKDHTKEKINLSDVYALLLRVEENQMMLSERFEDYMDNPSVSVPGHDEFSSPSPTNSQHHIANNQINLLLNRLEILEKQFKMVVDNVVSMSNAMQELQVTHKGTQSVVNHVAQLNQLTHSKISEMEESSKLNNNNPKLNPSNTPNPSTNWMILESASSNYTSIFTFGGIAILMSIIFYGIWKRKSTSRGSMFDKKFI